MQRAVSAVGLACLFACVGCGSDPIVIADGGSDAGPACATPEAFPMGSADGHASPLLAPAGEARAGRVVAADLPPDPAELATWAPGDYVLANDHLALVVSQVGRYEVYDPYAGRVRGLARVEGGHLVAPASFNVAIVGLGRFVVATESVSVLADGSDGGPAIVRNNIVVGSVGGGIVSYDYGGRGLVHGVHIVGNTVIGDGGAARVANRFGLALLGAIPLVRTLREAGDAGAPVVATDPDSDLGRLFLEIAENLSRILGVNAEAGHA